MRKDVNVKIKKDGGIGFLGALTIVLVVIKLLGLAEISWLFVFAPIWLPVLGFAGLVTIFGFAWLLVKIFKKIEKTTKK